MRLYRKIFLSLRSKSEEHVTNDLTSVLVNVYDQFHPECGKANIDRYVHQVHQLHQLLQ